MPRLPFTAPWLLAPMEGVTDPCFRAVLLARHRPEDLGGACTEFLRVVDHPYRPSQVRKHLGPKTGSIPVGVQLMGSHESALAATAESVLQTDAAFLDLNFGCPTKGALKGCAGSALLREPKRLESIVRTCVEACGGNLPVTAKIRAGFDDAENVEELAQAAEAGGASLLTVHCRTRSEHYTAEVDWTRITRAVEAVEIPVCGNGGVQVHADLERMRSVTGCAYVMVGHAALADPWIFSGQEVTAQASAEFLHEYSLALEGAGAGPRKRAARLKQLLKVWSAGRLITDAADRQSWMAERDPERLLVAMEARASAGVTP
ncbi:MAG: tRNA-dihydrouridine synthase family protein [Planctomycetota bacterium]|nr:tRNA-dihydrouridine synthase family protein [Planctomycetota bacterium]